MLPQFCHLAAFTVTVSLCVSFVQNEANKIKKEAKELDQLINRKLKDYEDLREDMKGKEMEVKNLLEKGKTEQQVSSAFCGFSSLIKAIKIRKSRDFPLKPF